MNQNYEDPNENPNGTTNGYERTLAGVLADAPPGGLPLAFARLRERFGDALFRETFFDTLSQNNGGETRPRFIQKNDFLIAVGDPPPMIVDRLIPEKSLILLAGKPKQGKSFLGLDIADSLCRGLPICGEYQVNRGGPVAYLGMEDGQFEIANRLLMRGDKRLKGDEPLYVLTERLVVSTPEGVAGLRRMIEEDLPQTPVLVIIDTAREGMDIKDWNDSSQVSEKIRPLREFARTVCSVLLIAHNRKAGAIDDGDEIAGSGAFASSVDGWMSVQRSEKQEDGNRRMWIKIVGRGSMNSEAVVEMDTRTLRFRVVSAQEEEQAARAEREIKKDARTRLVLDAVKRAVGSSATLREIADMIGESEQSTRRLVGDLEKAGLLKATGETKKSSATGRPAPLFGVVDNGRVRETLAAPFRLESGAENTGELVSFTPPSKENERKKLTPAAADAPSEPAAPTPARNVSRPTNATGAVWSREPVGLAGDVRWVLKAFGGMGFGATQADALAAFFDDLDAPTDHPDQVPLARRIAEAEYARLEADGEPRDPDAWLAAHQAAHRVTADTAAAAAQEEGKPE